MKVVKKTAEYTIYQKRSGRYAVKDADKNWVNESDKVAILLNEGLITAPAPKPAEPEQEETEATEDTAAEAVDEQAADSEAETGEAKEPAE